MPRRRRELVDGGYYHVFTRGNDKRRLFRSTGDYRCLVELIGEYVQKHPVHVVHYALMPNHVHLIAQVIETEQFPKFMQGVLQTYAIYFRNKYASAGYIFQNRYKSLSINDEVYLLECARYVERNPVRAELAAQAGDYRWSSYHFYADGRKDPIITRTNPLYDALGQTAEERRRRYAAFIHEKRPYEDIVDQAFKICRE